MDRSYFYDIMNGQGNLDYEMYLNTYKLLRLQKDFTEFCNHDELQFQVVHQSEELFLKLINYTLLDIDEYMAAGNTMRVLTLFKRVHTVQNLLIQILPVLETMSPKEYQEIRLQLGNGSGQESPGFRALLEMPQHLWLTFQKHYLTDKNLTVEATYHQQYTHGEAYMVAEALAEFDELFIKFRFNHFQLIRRSIGNEALSLKGRSVELLKRGVESCFFPELWKIRSQMTDAWGGQYGKVREAISSQEPTHSCKHL
jgi:tryptophan 2,3-dioxygenase